MPWSPPLSHWLSKPGVRACLPLLLVLIAGCVFHADGAFFRWATHRALLREISVVGILACGMTVVILAGGIDLAVGSVLGLSAVSFALSSLHWGWPACLCLVFVLCLSSGTGVASGLLVARAKMPPFIATLAMMVFARGLAKWLSGGQKISTYVPGADGSFESVPLPGIFSSIDSRVLGEQISVVTLVFLACVVSSHVLVRHMRVGRYFLAIGGNSEAARLSGIPVGKVLVLAYLFTGLLSGVAGICQAAQETQGDPETGLGYELDAIAMVVLGGTRLSGGQGGIGLTVVGALTLGYLQKLLSLNAFSTDARLMLTGVIVVAAFTFQKRLSR